MAANRYQAGTFDGGISFIVWDSIGRRVVRDDHGPLVFDLLGDARWWAEQLNGLRTVAEVQAGI